MSPSPTRARQLLQLAHQAAYRWPSTFAGFHAEVIAIAPDWWLGGRVHVVSPYGVTVHTDAPTMVARTVTIAIVGLASWQFPRSFTDADDRYEAVFRPDLDRPSGRAVELVDDPRGTLRWLDAEGLAETRYRMGDLVRQVEVLERDHLGDGRWLPTRVRETLHPRSGGTGPTTQVIESQYVAVGELWLPARRLVLDDRGERVFDIEINDHRLLPRRLFSEEAVESASP